MAAPAQRHDQVTDDFARLRQDVAADTACMRTEITQMQSQMSENISSLKTGLENVLRRLGKLTDSTTPAVAPAVSHNVRQRSATRLTPSVSYYNTDSEQPHRKLYGKPPFHVNDSATTFPMMTQQSRPVGHGAPMMTEQSNSVRSRMPQQIPEDHLTNAVRSQTYRRNPQPSRRPWPSSEACHLTDTESSNHGSEEIHSSSTRQNRRENRFYHPKLPAFTGQESWEVYYNRFKDVAAQEDWTDSEKFTGIATKITGKSRRVCVQPTII